MKHVDGYSCPPFVIQDPYGAAGALDVSVSPANTVWVEQYITVRIPNGARLIAEFVIDDNVIATSYPAEIDDVFSPPEKYPGAVQRLLFKFPPLAIDPQYVGVRYFVVTDEGRKLVTMHPC